MSDEQWLRKCDLFLTGISGNGVDLSQLRIKFNIKRSDVQTPNIAEIRVYNLKEETAQQIEKEFSRVTLQAGYEQNFGVIFQGNVKQVLRGREDATTTFLDIIAGDGDLSYNFAIVNTTLAAGVGQAEQVNAAIGAMTSTGGVAAGNVGEFPTEKLPRGKVMYGNAREYLSQVSKNSSKTWSIQDEKVQMVPLTSYLPGEVVELTSKTGLIGTPIQNTDGINIKCLLNPKLKVSSRVKINNKDIARLKIDFSQPGSPANIPAPINNDGVYYILVIEYQGDTRGNEWYCNLTCINMSIATNPLNAVQVGY